MAVRRIICRKFSPFPIFILPQHPLVQFLHILRKGEFITLEDGFRIYLIRADAVLHHRHETHFLCDDDSERSGGDSLNETSKHLRQNA